MISFFLAHLDWLASALSTLAMGYLSYNRPRLGWTIHLVGQPIWTAMILWNSLYGLLPLNVMMTAISLNGVIRGGRAARRVRATQHRVRRRVAQAARRDLTPL